MPDWSRNFVTENFEILRRGLGTQGLEVSAIHLGIGVSLLDTAEVYGPIPNEEAGWPVVRGRRDEAIIATIIWDADHAPRRGDRSELAAGVA